MKDDDCDAEKDGARVTDMASTTSRLLLVGDFSFPDMQSPAVEFLMMQ